MNAPVVLSVVFLLQVSISESGLTVHTPQPFPVAHVGSQVLLQCFFTVTPDVIDVKQLTVTWIQYAQTVATFTKGDIFEKQNLSLNAEGLKSGDASLLIRRVVLDDEGQYRCTVQHKGEEKDVDIHVNVRATPHVSIKLETNLSQSQGVVTCEAVSFYPQGISFNITRNSETLKIEKLTSSPSPSRWRLPDQSFSARSVYTFDVSDIRNSRDTFSCEVTHESVGQPITVSTTPVCGLTTGHVTWIVVVVLIVIVVLLVLLVLLILLLVLLYRWYSSSVKLSMITPLDEDDNVPTSLKCTLTGWRLKMVTVEWFENDNRIYTDHKPTDTECGTSVPLTDPCKYHIDRQCCGEENVLTLKIFCKSEDVLGAKFRCRATHRQTRRSVERSYEIHDRRAKPTVSNIQQNSTFENDDLELKVTASNFWPRNVTIEWFVDEEMKKEEELTGNPISGSDSYSAESVCRVTVQECENSRIMAKIHHESLNFPIVKTFTKRKGSLQCNINCLTYTKVHFPCVLLCELQGLKSDDKKVEMTWFRSPRSQGAKIKAGSDGWTIKSNKGFYVWEPNETLTYKNFLEFIPDEESELLMRYTCEVNHESLKEPFRRVLIPNLDRVIRPDVKLQKVVWTKNRCVLHCVIFNLHYPEDFKVTWTRKEKSTDKVEIVAGTEKWPAEISTVGPWMEAVNYKVISQLEFQPTPGSEDMTYCVTVDFPISEKSSRKRELNVRNLPAGQNRTRRHQ
ncbi:uncharacterized protein LOC120536417 [Polypterus senegalus]|uniref:uncharacterized protein LOC120536417 n=1 Tax=Polypterus senegalus TaxID=55291 RepID=UPI001963E3F9|nr:uncharacterized protein LOC120536417 [Polypterus senegalus]